MAFVNVAVLLYAILTIGLGAYGYFEKGSMPSLIAGGVAGLLLLGSLALAKTHPRIGRIAAAVIALLMLGQMGRKAMEDKTWHTITLAVASIIVIAILVGAHFYAMSKKKAGQATE
jgi:uncharacterized membrane protein (UPF0136 family)